MTRESEKSKIRMSVIVDGKHINSLKKADEVIDQIFDYFGEQLQDKDDEIERLFGLIKSLWQIIDDIDTYGDMAKSDDAFFRSLVEKKQKERWKLPIATDGYGIMLKDNA